MLEQIPEKFHMIIPREDDNYQYLPGIRAIFGGIWIAGLYYFGANQYIIQKAFGAKSLPEAQKGMVFAAYLKLLLPFIVVIPGMVAFVLLSVLVASSLGNLEQAFQFIQEYTGMISPEMPFLDQMLVAFFIVAAVIVLLSLFGKKEADKGIVLPKGIFKTERSFNLLSLIILLVLGVIYK
jgi:SSS family solute:Na+ symporter